MKKIILFGIVVLSFASCNLPKDGDKEEIPTNKLEVLTNLGDDTAKTAADTTAKH